ncbi:MAG: peroxidase family protein [Phycisphaerales bacterium]|jgi:peroxidase
MDAKKLNNACLLVLVAGLCLPTLAQDGPASPAGPVVEPRPETPDRRSSLVQRAYVTRFMPPLPLGNPNAPGVDDPATFPDEFRTINGRFNNLVVPWLGSTGQTFVRKAPAAYGDGAGRIPARSDGSSARAISQAIADQGGNDMPSNVGNSNMFWLWGQFLDHDMDETPIAVPIERFDIVVPAGDPWFDPEETGSQTIELDRSGYQLGAGPREQINAITAFIDASNVYGSDQERANELRSMDGTGRLKTSDGDLLPYNVNRFPNAPTHLNPTLFLAGDVRANEQVSLTAIHTLFVREHNYWADQIRAANPSFTGDEVYEHARAIVGGIMQAITYNEFLPLLLGPDAIPPYTGYDPGVDPGISNVFAAAAFRMGHSMLPTFLPRMDSDGTEADEGHLSLAQAFFQPTHISRYGIDSVLRGMSMKRAQQLDALIISDVRNLLFGIPGDGGFDLASLNIQRGRDHGLPDFNSVREAFGLPRVSDFIGVTSNAEMRDKLASVYADCDQIDPWVGFLVEDTVPGAMVGETLRAALSDQFIRLRDGDRFWYEAYLPADLVDTVNQQTLSTIIRRHTSIGDEILDDAFIAPAGCPADLDDDGTLTIFDFLAFQTLFAAGDLKADFNDDGVLDIFDFLLFQNAFDAGCD